MWDILMSATSLKSVDDVQDMQGSWGQKEKEQVLMKLDLRQHQDRMEQATENPGKSGCRSDSLGNSH